MLLVRRVSMLAAIVVFSIGVAGCGGGVPSTGETVNVQKGDVERRNAMVEGYQKNMPPPKAVAKTTKSKP